MNAGFDVPDVHPGDNILQAWRELQRAEGAATVRTGKACRRTRLPMGVALTIDSKRSIFGGSFKASLIGLNVTVGRGLVNNIMPLINGTRLDAATPPQLAISGPPNDDMRSFVCLQIKVDLETGAFDPEDEEAVTIVHSLTPNTLNGAPLPDEMWHHAIAEIKWADAKTPSQIFQITRFDVQHKFYPATGGRGARHAVWPA